MHINFKELTEKVTLSVQPNNQCCIVHVFDGVEPRAMISIICDTWEEYIEFCKKFDFDVTISVQTQFTSHGEREVMTNNGTWITVKNGEWITASNMREAIGL